MKINQNQCTMKKVFLVFAAIAFVIACSKDETTTLPTSQTLNPQKVQWGLCIEYTATWCGPCGNWGAPLAHEVYNMGKVAVIACHVSNDPMYDAALYSSLTNDRSTGGGVPAFWMGDTKTSSSSAMTQLLTKIPDASVDLTYSISNGKMKVNTRSKFFNAVSGDYYLSVFVLEDGIDGSSTAGDYAQNGVSNPTTYKHDFVLRASATSNCYGEQIATGSIAANKSIDKSYEITLKSDWKKTLYPCAVLWKKETGTPAYKYVNAIYKK